MAEDFSRLAPAVERRRNLIAMAVMVAVLVLVGLFAYRPATIVGVDGQSLADSVGLGGNCRAESDDVWQCEVGAPGGSGIERWAVKTRSFGCWDAWHGEVSEIDGKPTQAGCINILDAI